MKASVGSSSSILVGLVRFYLVLSLLVDGLLVKHVESSLTVSGTHHSGTFVDDGREKSRSTFESVGVGG